MIVCVVQVPLCACASPSVCPNSLLANTPPASVRVIVPSISTMTTRSVDFHKNIPAFERICPFDRKSSEFRPSRSGRAAISFKAGVQDPSMNTHLCAEKLVSATTQQQRCLVVFNTQIEIFESFKGQACRIDDIEDCILAYEQQLHMHRGIKARDFTDQYTRRLIQNTFHPFLFASADLSSSH